MIIDISWPLVAGMTTYKNRHQLHIESVRVIAEHGVADSLCRNLHMHAGTHIDAPAHFIAGGATIDQLSLAQMNGPCRVLDVAHVQHKITANDLIPFNLVAGERILLKTKNSFNSPIAVYDGSEIYLAGCAARYCATVGVGLVGIDALGLERDQSDYASHLALFNAGIIIVEGLRLAPVSVVDCTYELHLLPLAFVGTEAAPARAVLTR